MIVIRHLFAVILALSLTACASMISSTTQRMADNISQAMLNQNDPQTVRQAMPAYLVLIDSLVQGDPENPKILLSASRLYGSYGSAFVEDEKRARRLARKALDHAQQALCISIQGLCDIRKLELDQLGASLALTEASDHPLLYGFASAWAGWIQAHSGDWNAIAEIPRLNVLFRHGVQVDERFDRGGGHLYLGVLNSQLPPAVGGKPEVGREHFDQAIEISEGKNLMAKVLYAKHYARLVFDQALHDRLLKEVLADNAEHEGLVLINALARQRAAELLAESPEFF